MSDLSVTKEEFEILLETETKPILVDFWAPWCGPCRALSPIIEEFATENENFKVVKIDIDEESELSEQYSIQSIPALFVFKAGKKVKSQFGSVSKSGLLEFVK